MQGRLLIRGGSAMDGTGAPAQRADVLIAGDRIEDVGLFPDARCPQVIDASGLSVAPGFIDVHTHLDFLLPSPRHVEVLESGARQGVTTIVAGNCGFSPAPVAPEVQQDISTYWSFALPRDGLDYQWSNMAEYLDHLERIGQAYNVAILTGQNVIRRGAHADLTLFDAETVACQASFEHPDRSAAGIEYVIINGTPVLERGKYRADALAGRSLRASPG